jgi:hypothetical protein
MTRQKIVVVSGNTDTGKSTISNYLRDHHRFKEFVPYAFYKRFLEDTYQCPSLETDEGKAFVPPGMEMDMKQYTVNHFHWMAENDPYFTTRKMSVDLPNLISSGADIVISGVRNLPEINFLMTFLKKTYNPDLVEYYFINVSREGRLGRTSDHLQPALVTWSRLEYPSFSFEVCNDSTEEVLIQKVLSIVFPD